MLTTRWGWILPLLLVAFSAWAGYAYRDREALIEASKVQKELDDAKKKADQVAEDMGRGMVLVSRYLDGRLKATEKRLNELRNRPWYSNCVPDADGLSAFHDQIREINDARGSSVRLPENSGTSVGAAYP